MNEITQILEAIAGGNFADANELVSLVHTELRQQAALCLAREHAGYTLTPTALVHEVYLKLVPDGVVPNWENRRHFFGAAAQAMRRILVDRARERNSAKRNGGVLPVHIEMDRLAAPITDDALLDLDSVLDALAERDPDAARIVQMHIFAGMSIDDIATALGISRATAYRDWAYARAWLRDRLNPE